jgi:hypothetical protein
MGFSQPGATLLRIVLERVLLKVAFGSQLSILSQSVARLRCFGSGSCGFNRQIS